MEGLRFRCGPRGGLQRKGGRGSIDPLGEVGGDRAYRRRDSPQASWRVLLGLGRAEHRAKSSLQPVPAWLIMSGIPVALAGAPAWLFWRLLARRRPKSSDSRPVGVCRAEVIE